MSRLSVSLKRRLKKIRLARAFKRRVAGEMTFVTYEDLVGLSREFSNELGGHDCVVGIPRTGLVAAAVIANCLGLPLFAPETLPRDKYKAILLVDDGCTSHHGTMERIAGQVKPKTKAAIFTTQEGKRSVDKYMFLIQKPALYEWDLFQINPPTVDDCKAFDLDGVLCKDPPDHVTSEEYALHAEPFHIPNFRIGYIITGRPEALRVATEKWLQKHGVEYGELIFTKNKIDTILEKVPSIYYESDYETAKVLAKRTHIPILAVDRMELLYE